MNIKVSHKKTSRIILAAVLLMVSFIGPVNGQWSIYDGSVSPSTLTPRAFITASDTPVAPDISGNHDVIIPEPGIPANSLLRMRNTVAATRFLWRMNFASSPAITVTDLTIVMRVRGLNGHTHALDLDMEHNGGRSRLTINTENRLARIRNGTGENRHMPVPTNDWIIYRFAMTATETLVFVNENPEPVLTFSPAVTGSSTRHFRFGDNDNLSTLGSDIDWIIWDVSGAYAPGEGTPVPFSSLTPDWDVLLSDIGINNATIEGFHPAVTNYEILLPPGITQIPQITATAQTGMVTITQALSLPGKATIEVTSPDGSISRTYSISLQVEAMALPQPVGWASVNAEGQNGTTGGAGGMVVTVSNLTELINRAQESWPLQILIDGMIDLSPLTESGRYVFVSSNKTIQGAGPGAGIRNGGFRVLDGARNIIFRNLNILDAPDDGIQINGFITHVWIDHCTFRRNTDGAVDISNGASFITLSNNLFEETNRATLIGHSDNDPIRNRLQVTLHHNWFNRSIQRHPRVRFGQVHVFNNYYLGAPGTIYGIGIGVGAQIVSESNFFEGVSAPSRFYDTATIPGFFRDNASVLLNSGAFASRPEGINWKPSDYYAYNPDPANNVKDIVMARAGAEPITTNIGRPASIQPVVTLMIYPNPGRHFVNLMVDLPVGGQLEAALFDLMGRKVKHVAGQHLSAGINRLRIDRQGLPTGMYFLTVVFENQRITHKLIFD